MAWVLSFEIHILTQEIYNFNFVLLVACPSTNNFINSSRSRTLLRLVARVVNINHYSEGTAEVIAFSVCYRQGEDMYAMW